MVVRGWMQIALLFLTASLALVALAYDLDQHRWSERLLVLVTPQADDPALQEQLRTIGRRNDAMLDRELELVQLHLETGRVRDRTLSSDEVKQLRSRLGLSDGDRLLILIGKDGGVKRRATLDSDLGEVFLQIDAMPMRRSEISAKRAAGLEVTPP